jgi:histidine triad (HIT) family protein
MENCAFCRIAKNESPASIVYEDEKTIAFMDIHPVNQGHTLVIPRVHATGLQNLDEEAGTHMFKIAVQVSEAIRRSGIRCEGINLHLADGPVAGQEVPHVHLHVIPRFRGDGFGIRFGRSYSVKPDRKELDETANRIKEKLR